MAIKLAPQANARFMASIKRFVEEQMDEEIGELKATLFLEFVMREIAPTVYNQAVADAQARLHDAVTDLDGSCHEPDPGYWTRR